MKETKQAFMAEALYKELKPIADHIRNIEYTGMRPDQISAMIHLKVHMYTFFTMMEDFNDDEGRSEQSVNPVREIYRRVREICFPRKEKRLS